MFVLHDYTVFSIIIIVYTLHHITVLSLQQYFYLQMCINIYTQCNAILHVDAIADLNSCC